MTLGNVHFAASPQSRSRVNDVIESHLRPDLGAFVVGQQVKLRQGWRWKFAVVSRIDEDANGGFPTYAIEVEVRFRFQHFINLH